MEVLSDSHHGGRGGHGLHRVMMADRAAISIEASRQLRAGRQRRKEGTGAIAVKSRPSPFYTDLTSASATASASPGPQSPLIGNYFSLFGKLSGSPPLPGLDSWSLRPRHSCSRRYAGTSQTTDEKKAALLS